MVQSLAQPVFVDEIAPHDSRKSIAQGLYGGDQRRCGQPVSPQRADGRFRQHFVELEIVRVEKLDLAGFPLRLEPHLYVGQLGPEPLRGVPVVREILG